MARNETVRLYVLSVAGVTHHNTDGMHRQRILKDMRLAPELRYLGPYNHETIHLEPEPDNPYDPNAIKMMRGNGFEQIGYVPADDAIDLAAAIRAGCCIKAKLLGVFGGDAERPTLGARVLVAHAAPGFDEGRLLRYLEGMLEQYGGGLQRPPTEPAGPQGELYDPGMYGGAHFEEW